MCGIYGVFGQAINKNDLAALYTLSFVNMMRGMHSTGVMRAWFDRKRRVEILKDTVPAVSFFSNPNHKKIMEDTWPVAIMCHNRYATVGASDNRDGAHPFETEKYVGFHNGTLREDKYRDDPRFLTDSESLWNDVDARGFGEVLPPLYKESAFALAYYEKESGRVGFVRNDRRPLAFAAHQTRSVVFYSSDEADLRYAMDKHNIDANIYTLGAWQNITTDPRALNFSKPEDKRDLRTNLWRIDKYEPKPEEPPQSNVVEYAPRGRYTQNNYQPPANSAVFTCKLCPEELHWSRPGQPKTKNPKWIKNLGNICWKCQDHLESLHGIDLDDDDADAYIGALNVSVH